MVYLANLKRIRSSNWRIPVYSTLICGVGKDCKKIMYSKEERMSVPPGSLWTVIEVVNFLSPVSFSFASNTSDSSCLPL